MRHPTRLLVLLVLLLAGAVPPAAASSAPPDDVMLLELGLGGGSAGIRSGDRERSGLAITTRVGGLVRPRLAAEFAIDGWTRSLEGQTLSLSVTTLGLGAYSADHAFAVHAGVGLARGVATKPVGNAYAYDAQNGFGASAGAGWTFRPWRTIGFGPHVGVMWGHIPAAEFHVVDACVSVRWFPPARRTR